MMGRAPSISTARPGKLNPVSGKSESGVEKLGLVSHVTYLCEVYLELYLCEVYMNLSLYAFSTGGARS